MTWWNFSLLMVGQDFPDCRIQKKNFLNNRVEFSFCNGRIGFHDCKVEFLFPNGRVEFLDCRVTT
jgi:hypothetical protein